MKWLARVENSHSPEANPTKATKPPSEPQKRGFVGFVAYAQGENEKFAPANDATRNPGTWPHGTAWNAAEIDLFTQRLALFTDRGLSLAGAQGLAEQLLARDRDLDDRTLCIECAHYRRGCCLNWAAAGFVKARDAEAMGDYASTLKRCAGFVDTSHQRVKL